MKMKNTTNKEGIFMSLDESVEMLKCLGFKRFYVYKWLEKPYW